MMPDAGALDAGIQVVTHLALVVAVQLLAEKGRNVLRLDGVNQGFRRWG